MNALDYSIFMCVEKQINQIWDDQNNVSPLDLNMLNNYCKGTIRLGKGENGLVSFCVVAKECCGYKPFNLNAFQMFPEHSISNYQFTKIWFKDSSNMLILKLCVTWDGYLQVFS